MLHLNGEWVNPYGIAYAKVGAFYKNGSGHLDSKSVDGDYKSRLGAGVDLAYVL
ncbi:hypothetical protein J751_3613 [Acinetobacter baumannii 24812_8]|nr:hypothetical protein J751_3613 [Acinetobacter baumannii 24812_8]